MDPMTWIALATMALGVMRDAKQNSSYNQQLNIAAEKERWSPFTGQHGSMPQQVNPLANTMQAGVQAFEFWNKNKSNSESESQDSSSFASQNPLAGQNLNYYDYMINPSFSYVGKGNGNV
jgi:hypothetical protein